METAWQMWEGFAKSTLPKGCSDVQRKEMRRAFYGGVFSLLTELTHVVGDDNVPEEVGEKFLQDLDRELKAFYAAVKAGQA